MVDVREVAEKVYRFETPIAGMFYTPVVYLIDAPGETTDSERGRGPAHLAT